jgi:Flp pilus assembly protein TadG
VTVELAIVVPLLIALILGIVDVGQFVNVSQTVSSASLDAAKLAAQNGTATVTQVESAFSAYLADSFPSIPQSTFDTDATVTVTDGAGNPIPSGDLTTLPTGSIIQVDVLLPFDTVRWVSALPLLSNKSLAITTTVRRE